MDKTCNQKLNKAIWLVTAILLFIIVFSLALMVGRYNISISNFFKALFTSDSSVKTDRNVIMNLRLPRTIVAALAGISLSLSGLMYQELFQNKLVSPDLLGVSAGSGVGAALGFVLGFSIAEVGILAFLFGFGTVLAVITITKIFKNKSSLSLLIAGIVVGGFMSSLLSVFKYLADPNTTLVEITYWLMGSFEDSTMKDVIIFALIVIISSGVLWLMSWKINVVALGKEEAQSKGVNYVVLRFVIIGIVTLLTATSVAFCGTISWVGLVIPHIVRLLIKGKNTTQSIPFTIAFGGIFMMIVDIFARSLTNSEIPISAVSGILGTVIFIVILIKNRRQMYEH